MSELLEISGNVLRLPAFATAHSHAFQRGMRGRAQRPGPSGTDDFWSWRKEMYELAERLTPESIYEISRVAYEELRQAGVLYVGEFHYVHHQPDGTPYEDRTLLAESVIRAAKDAGLKIALLRVVYRRAGAGREPEGAQRRFADLSLDDALRDVEELSSRYANDEDVRIGIAPHSVRAVPPSWLRPIAELANERALPLHMHVAEQPAEIAACLDETSMRPVELLAKEGVLGPRFVAVHATHLEAHEARLLGEAKAFACLCPTTERDLGDGLPDLTALREAGVRICTGVDSHVLTDPFEDMRGIELGERLRTQKRVTDRGAEGTLAERLWLSASHEGARAIGFPSVEGKVELRRDAHQLALVDPDYLLDALVFSGSPALVAQVVRAPSCTVEGT